MADCLCHVRGDLEIVYCPLHAAAPELLEALKETAFAYHVEAEHKQGFSACPNTYCATACRLFNEHAAARKAS